MPRHDPSIPTRTSWGRNTAATIRTLEDLHAQYMSLRKIDDDAAFRVQEKLRAELERVSTALCIGGMDFAPSVGHLMHVVTCLIDARRSDPIPAEDGDEEFSSFSLVVLSFRVLAVAFDQVAGAIAMVVSARRMTLEVMLYYLTKTDALRRYRDLTEELLRCFNFLSVELGHVLLEKRVVRTLSMLESILTDTHLRELCLSTMANICSVADSSEAALILPEIQEMNAAMGRQVHQFTNDVVSAADLKLLVRRGECIAHVCDRLLSNPGVLQRTRVVLQAVVKNMAHLLHFSLLAERVTPSMGVTLRAVALSCWTSIYYANPTEAVALFLEHQILQLVCQTAMHLIGCGGGGGGGGVRGTPRAVALAAATSQLDSMHRDDLDNLSSGGDSDESFLSDHQNHSGESSAGGPSSVVSELSGHGSTTRQSSDRSVSFASSPGNAANDSSTLAAVQARLAAEDDFTNHYLTDEMNLLPLLEFFLSIVPPASEKYSHLDNNSLAVPYYVWKREDRFRDSVTCSREISRSLERDYGRYRRDNRKYRAAHVSLNYATTVFADFRSQTCSSAASGGFQHSVVRFTLRREPLISGYIHLQRNCFLSGCRCGRTRSAASETLVSKVCHMRADTEMARARAFERCDYPQTSGSPATAAASGGGEEDVSASAFSGSVNPLAPGARAQTSGGNVNDSSRADDDGASSGGCLRRLCCCFGGGSKKKKKPTIARPRVLTRAQLRAATGKNPQIGSFVPSDIDIFPDDYAKSIDAAARAAYATVLGLEVLLTACTPAIVAILQHTVNPFVSRHGSLLLLRFLSLAATFCSLPRTASAEPTQATENIPDSSANASATSAPGRGTGTAQDEGEEAVQSPPSCQDVENICRLITSTTLTPHELICLLLTSIDPRQALVIASNPLEGWDVDEHSSRVLEVLGMSNKFQTFCLTLRTEMQLAALDGLLILYAFRSRAFAQNGAPSGDPLGCTARSRPFFFSNQRTQLTTMANAVECQNAVEVEVEDDGSALNRTSRPSLRCPYHWTPKRLLERLCLAFTRLQQVVEEVDGPADRGSDDDDWHLAAPIGGLISVSTESGSPEMPTSSPSPIPAAMGLVRSGRRPNSSNGGDLGSLLLAWATDPSFHPAVPRGRRLSNEIVQRVAGMDHVQCDSAKPAIAVYEYMIKHCAVTEFFNFIVEHDQLLADVSLPLQQWTTNRLNQLVQERMILISSFSDMTPEVLKAAQPVDEETKMRLQNLQQDLSFAIAERLGLPPLEDHFSSLQHQPYEFNKRLKRSKTRLHVENLVWNPLRIELKRFANDATWDTARGLSDLAPRTDEELKLLFMPSVTEDPMSFLSLHLFSQRMRVIPMTTIGALAGAIAEEIMKQKPSRRYQRGVHMESDGSKAQWDHTRQEDDRYGNPMDSAVGRRKELVIFPTQILLFIDGVPLLRPLMTVLDALCFYANSGKSLRNYVLKAPAAHMGSRSYSDVIAHGDSSLPSLVEVRQLKFWSILHRMEYVVLEKPLPEVLFSAHYCGCGMPNVKPNFFCSPRHIFTSLVSKGAGPGSNGNDAVAFDGALRLLNAVTVFLEGSADDERQTHEAAMDPLSTMESGALGSQQFLLGSPTADEAGGFTTSKREPQRRLCSAIVHELFCQLSCFAVPPLMNCFICNTATDSFQNNKVSKDHVPSYILWNYHQIFPFNMRLALLHMLLVTLPRPKMFRQLLHNRHHGTIVGAQWLSNDRITERSTRVAAAVKRSNLLQQADTVLRRYASCPLQLDICFDGEPGIGSGPALEFYDLLAKAFQNPELGMWRTIASSATSHERLVDPLLYPSATQTPSSLYHFQTLGLLLARLIRLHRPADLRLHPLFLRGLRGESLVSTTFEARKNMALLDGVMEKSLHRIEKLSESDLLAVGLTFVLPHQEEGASDRVIELIPNGANVVVTAKSVLEYTDLIRRYYLQVALDAALTHFCLGLSFSVNPNYLEFFSVEELERIFCGEEGKLWNTTEEFSRDVITSHGYTRFSPVVQYLLAIIPSWSPAQQRQFLQFVTGSRSIPLGGLQNPITVVRRDGGGSNASHTSMRHTMAASEFGVSMGAADDDIGDNSALPTASTCFNYLKLPPYSSKEVTEQRLLTAVREGQGCFMLT